jgi:VCBS repeat-containing protein
MTNSAPVITIINKTETLKEDTTFEFSSAKDNPITVADIDLETAAAPAGLNFDGSSTSYLKVADTKISGDITIEAWVNVTVLPVNGAQRFLDFAEELKINSTGFGLRVYENAFIFDNLDSSGTLRSIISTSRFTNGWHHVAISVSETGQAKFYVDGLAAGSGNIGVVANVPRPDSYLGRNDFEGASNFVGQMRDVRLWDVERSQAQIQAEMQTLTNPDADGLRAWYPMNETGGSIVANNALVTVADGLSADDVVAINAAVAIPNSVMRIGSLRTTLTATQGTLVLGNTQSGARIIAGADSSASITLSGTAAQINSAISGLVYKPNTNYNGSAALIVTTSDGMLSNTQTIKLTVTPVNDTPATTIGRKSETFDEDTTLVFSTTAGNAIKVADVDSAYLTTTVSASQGTLVMGSQNSEVDITGGADSSASITISGTAEQINIALEGLAYTPDANYNGTAVLSVTTSHGALRSTQNIDLTIAPVNDSPVITIGRAWEVSDEDKPQMFGDATKNAITVTDVDDTALTTTLTVSEGTLTLGPGSKNVTITAGSDNSKTVTLSGTAEQINQAINDLAYTPLPNANGTKTLTVTADDRANALSGTKSLYFDGFENHVTLPDPGISGDITIEAWVNITTPLSNVSLFEFSAFDGLTYTDSILLRFDGSGGLQFCSVDDGIGRPDIWITNPSALKLGSHHIAASISNDGTGTIYIDGVKVVSGFVGAAASTARGVSYIGRSTWAGSSFFSGQMRDIRVWDTERIESEIMAQMGTWITSAPESADAKGLKVWIPVTDAGALTNMANGAATPAVQPYQPALVAAESITKTIRLHVIPVEDASVIKGDVSVTVQETNAVLNTSGQLMLTDIDNTSTATPFIAQTNVPGSGEYGTFSLSSTGAWTYATNTAHDEFVAGKTYTDTLKVFATDGTPATITVTIVGTDDLAVIKGDVSAKLTETNAVLNTSGQLTLTDADNTVSTTPFIAQTNAEGSGKYGKFSLSSSGAWTYATNTAHDEFVAGVIYTDTLNVVATDGTSATITVTIVGTNEAAVIKGDVSVTLSETNRVRRTSGKLNITDVDGPATFIAQTNAEGSGKYGKFSLSSTGAWTYATNTAHDEFVAGVTYTDILNLAATDGTPATITVTIVGTDDLAVIGGDVSFKLTETNAVLNTSGQLTLTDVDSTVSDTSFIAQTNVPGSGKYGKFSLNSSGAWTYATDTAHDEFVVGKTYTDTLRVLAADGARATITVTIVGTNDAAVIGGTSSAALVETNAVLKTSDKLDITDVDGPATFAARKNAVGSGKYGKFNLSSTGAWTYVTDSAHNEFIAGVTYTDTLSVAATDGTPATITVTIVGTNEAAVIGGTVSVKLKETNAVLTTKGQLTLTDADDIVSANPFIAQTNAEGSGKYGKFSLSSTGAWTYATNTAHDEFVAGVTYTDILNLAATDGTPATITVTIVGTDDLAVIGGDVSFKLTETNAVLNTSGQLTLTDVDSTVSDTSFIAQTNVPGSGKYGKFSLNSSGAWTYATDTAHDEFVVGKTYTDTLRVLAADGARATITVTIVGTNDAAVIGGTSSAALVETNAVLKTSDKLDITDVDGPATFAARKNAVGSGKYGKFNLSSTGAWTYVTDSAHNEFIAGVTYTDTLSVAATDGTPATITVNIVGTDDAAVIKGDVSVTLKETTAVLTTGGQLVLADVDSTVSAAPFIAQTNIAGKYGKFSLSNTGAWTYATNTVHDEFVAGKTYTDTLSVAATQGTSATITVSIVARPSLKTWTAAQISVLFASEVSALTASQIDTISSDAASGFTALQIPYLSSAALARFTAGQVAALSLNALAELTATQIGFMSAVALIGLTKTQIPALSTNAVFGLTATTLVGFSTASKLPYMTEAQIAGLSPTAIGSLTVAQLLTFSNQQLQYLTPAHIKALEGQKLDNGAAITIDSLTMPRVNTSKSSTAVISSWTNNQLKLLSTAQWSAMSPAQIGAISPTALAEFTTTEIFSKISEAQLKGLRTKQYMAWSATSRNALTSEQLTGLGVNFLKEMTTENVMGMTTGQRQNLSMSQVQGLPTYAVSGLTSAYLDQLFADGFFAKFSGLQARQLTPKALAAINSASFTFILNANFHGLLSTQIKALPDSVWAQATSAALDAMQILSFQAITTSQIAALPINAINGLSQNRKSALTKAQVGGLTKAQINVNSSLTGLQVAGLSGAQLTTINPEIFATLSVTQLAAITSDAIGSLTASQLASLSPDKIRALTIVQVAALSTSAVAGLTSDQFLAMTQTQIAAITVAQKAAFNNLQREYLATALQTLADDLKVAKLLYADTWILLTSDRKSRSMEDNYKDFDDAEHQWDIVKSASDQEDNTELKLFNYGSQWSDDQIVALPIALGTGSWQSSLNLDFSTYYSGPYDDVTPHVIYQRQQLAALTTDLANILSYGSGRALQFVRPFSLNGILEYASQSGSINNSNIHYLSGQAVSTLSTTAFTNLLKANAYWSLESFNANSHQVGAVSSDNPFGVGIVKNLSPENLAIYIAELNTHYENRTSTASPSILFSDELFSELSDTQKLTFLNSSLYKLTPAQLQSLSVDLIGKISGEALKNLVDVRPDLLRSFTETQIGCLLIAAIEKLAEKIVNFTADQFLAFTGLQIMGIESPAAWRAVVADYSDIAQGYIDRNPVYLSGGAISTLSPSEISRLPSIVVRNLSETNIEALSLELVENQLTGKRQSQVGALTVAQVALLSKEQLGWFGSKISSLAHDAIQILTTEQLKGVSEDLIKKLPVKPIVLMSPNEVAAVAVSSLLNLSSKAIATLSDVQLVGMTKTQVLNLLPSQYLAISAEQLKLLKATPVTMMSEAQLRALSVAEIQSLDVAQFELFSAGQLRAMSTEQIQALSEGQISRLQPWAVGGLQITTLSKFTDAQAKYLTKEQLISVDSSVAKDFSERWKLLTLKDGVKEVLAKIKTPSARIPKEIRSVYIISNLARSSQSYYDAYGSWSWGQRVSGSEISGQTQQQKDRDDKKRAVFWAQQKFQQNQNESAYHRQTLQKGRAYGSALALGSVVSAFGMANQAREDGDHLTSFVYSLAGMAYFASLLQVPINELVKYTLTLEELKARLQLTDDFGLKVQLQSDIEEYRKTARAKWGISSFTSPSASRDTIDLDAKPIDHVPVDSVGLGKATEWERHEKRFRDWDTKRKASVIFMVADVLGLGYSAYQLGTAIQSKDNVKIGLGAADLFGNYLVLLGDGIDFRMKPGLKTSIYQSRMLGRGLILIQLASSGASLYSNAKYYIDNPKNNRARDALIADAFIQATLLAATVLAIAFPVLAIPILIAVLFVPSAAAIRAVQELKDQQTSFNHQGRTVWGNTVLASLIKIAEMNVISITAVVNTFTSKTELKTLREKMKGGKMQQLLGEDYKYFLESEMVPTTVNNVTTQVYQKTLRTISNDIAKSLSSKEDGAIKIAAFINIMRLSADEANYYASETKNILTYASRLDVRKNKADGTMDFDTVAFGLAESEAIMKTTINDVVGTEKDSLIIVNVSSEEKSDKNKEIIITDNTSNNKVNYYITVDNAHVLPSKTSSSVITIVEGLANNVKVTSLSGKDIVSYSGASLDETGAIKLTEDATLWNVIDLDKFINVAAVIAGATTVHNIVTGTNAKQNYSFNNGRDTVNMSGGQGTVVVGGRETVLKMRGGNNFASVKLGGRVDGMAWSRDAVLGVYDGGAVVAASGTIGEEGYLYGTNMISFAEAYASLKIDIVDPLSSSVDATYSTYSKVTTQGLDLEDIGAFRNFQLVIGSNFGDTIDVNRTSTLQSLTLGMGQNSVVIKDVKAPAKTSAADKSVLMITALISLNAAPSDITIDSSDVGFEGSVNSNNLIQVVNASSFVGALRGNDRIFTDQDSGNLVKAVYAEGQHVLNLHGGVAEVLMFSGSSGDAVITVDENATTAITTALILSGNQLTQMVFRDSEGLHFSLEQSNGDAQEVDYSFGNETSDLAKNSLTVVKLFKDDGKQVAVTVAALNDAINALSGKTSYSTATTAVTFGSLYTEALRLHPNVL